MEEIFSIQYKSKGEKEFIVPFSIENISEIRVFIDDVLQNNKDYNVKVFPDELNLSFNYSPPNKVKVIFYNPVGDLLNPKIVTIEKISLVDRKTNFKDYSEFKAHNLNIEFNNIINILKSFKVLLDNNVIKSKLIDNKKIIILPKIDEGKGLYWGKDGELLNTDQNINKLLNEIAERFPDNNTTTKILANRIKVNITKTYIKKENLQEFLEQLDIKTFNNNTSINNINKILEEQTTSINSLTHRVNSIITHIEEINILIKNLQKNISGINEKLKELGDNNSYGSVKSLYGVINCSKNSNRLGNYLVASKEHPYKLNLVNISNNMPLILSLVNKGKNILFCGDNIAKFEKPFCNFLPTRAGRYYIRGEYYEKTGKINLVAHKSKPYFGLERPSEEVLIAHGCVPNASDYFVINDMSFYIGSGPYKDQPACYIYLGYVSLNDDGEVVSDIVLFSEQKSYETYLDVQANGNYVVPNLIGCNCIDIRISGCFENRVLTPVCFQGKFNKDNPHVLEMGTNFQYNLEEIYINTSSLGAMGYHKGNQVLTSDKIKLKIEVKRTF